MLTVDFRRFPVRPGHRVLDLGCGGGRHAFEVYRRGADVVAFDLDPAELAPVTGMFGAMRAAGEASPGADATAISGDATAMPFGDGMFDRVIAAEVLEHILDDQRAMNELGRVLRPGGLAAITVPSFLPERICWALSTEYHEVPGGHVRIYTRVELEAKLARAGLTALWHHHAHGLHSPYWWLKCAVGVHHDKHRLTSAYHRLLVWDIMRRPAVTRLAEQALNPLIGKSLVVYAVKPEPGQGQGQGQGVRGDGESPCEQGGSGGDRSPGEMLPRADVLATGESIARMQDRSGAIAWPDGHVDAWDHVECAMALSACGLRQPARRAYQWLREAQRADGSWPRSVEAGRVTDPAAESHHAAYVAVGAWHEYLVTGDERHALAMWPTVRRAVEWALELRTPRGEVRWERDAAGLPGTYALLSGCASIHQSLRCAVALAKLADDPRPDWELAADQLGHLVARHPEAFANKSRFAMDWYYPVLGGAVRGEDADRRVASAWDTFVVPGLGVRCVSDEPWVTAAETCELVIALDACGMRDRALEVFASVQHLRHQDGSYWTGWQFANQAPFPRERSSWTAAAVVLAADALTGFSGGAGIFRDAADEAGQPGDRTACGCDADAPRGTR